MSIHSAQHGQAGTPSEAWNGLVKLSRDAPQPSLEQFWHRIDSLLHHNSQRSDVQLQQDIRTVVDTFRGMAAQLIARGESSNSVVEYFSCIKPQLFRMGNYEHWSELDLLNSDEQANADAIEAVIAISEGL